ncbi:hypothetical protein KEM55_004199 [Ascosphaera atra]|nr:hypothetical protein KEM55_004199 [Ascosphaera atra]
MIRDMMLQTKEESTPDESEAQEKPAWKNVRKTCFLALGGAFVSLQLLFLCNMLYMHGSQYKMTERYHNLNILYINYDGSAIGQAVLDAYDGLRGLDFPTLHQKPMDLYPTYDDARQAVCQGHYWAAIYADKDATKHLMSSMVNGTDLTNSVSYVWNSVLWPPFTESGVHANIEMLLEAARRTYFSNNAVADLGLTNFSNSNAFTAFLNPVRTREIDIMPTKQGARILYNTVSMVMPIIQQFFFMVALNEIAEQFQVFTILGWKVNYLARVVISYSFTLSTALCMAGYFWTYREAWDVDGAQYALSVLILWVYAHIHSLMVELGTAFLPFPLMPFCVLTWIILNVTSTVAPFEISPGFYQWGYALPGRNTYEILLQIWSRGCNNKLYRTLPVMLTWEIIGSMLVPWGIQRRCKAAAAKRPREDTSPTESVQDQQVAATSPLSFKDESPESGPETNLLQHRSLSQRLSRRLSQFPYLPSLPFPYLNEDPPAVDRSRVRSTNMPQMIMFGRETNQPSPLADGRLIRYSFEDDNHIGPAMI